jgi:hypothetical protein
MRNAGILGGKFMERTRVLKPGSSLSDANGPIYYGIEDLRMGARITVLSRNFVLLDADEYVFNYLESYPEKFAYSNKDVIRQKAQCEIGRLDPTKREDLKARFRKLDTTNCGKVTRQQFVSIIQEVLPGSFSDHEIVTYSRMIEKQPRFPEYVGLIE